MPRRSLLSFHILTGTIPSTMLDVSDDNIDGVVPAFSSSVTVKRDENVNIGTDCSDCSPTIAILGSLLLVLCVFIGVLVFFLCRAKVEPSSHVTNAGSSLDGETRGISIMGSSGPREFQLVKDDCLVFSVQVLKNATDNFNEQNILGMDGFGSVYKGEWNDGTKIDVKKMKPGLTSGKCLELFESEIFAHTKVRHINLVKLLGYFIYESERHLVFELMKQGTLSRFLFNWNKEGLKPLEWRKRLGIALDVAKGVEYLKGFADKSFIHIDLKTSNILLGDDMRAKVTDFGLVRHVPPDREASAAYKVVGTFGYIAPECACSFSISW
ncbi:receptor-like kinase TMK2 [Primulina eburnea]|uniref:receptor-like kinase TMK2 n=1 Tax=Primulina eburnea TaxID=1245227 RepID=UPI003C6C82FA